MSNMDGRQTAKFAALFHAYRTTAIRERKPVAVNPLALNFFRVFDDSNSPHNRYKPIFVIHCTTLLKVDRPRADQSRYC